MESKEVLCRTVLLSVRAFFACRSSAVVLCAETIYAEWGPRFTAAESQAQITTGLIIRGSYRK